MKFPSIFWTGVGLTALLYCADGATLFRTARADETVSYIWHRKDPDHVVQAHIIKIADASRAPADHFFRFDYCDVGFSDTSGEFLTRNCHPIVPDTNGLGAYKPSVKFKLKHPEASCGSPELSRSDHLILQTMNATKTLGARNRVRLGRWPEGAARNSYFNLLHASGYNPGLVFFKDEAGKDFEAGIRTAAVYAPIAFGIFTGGSTLAWAGYRAIVSKFALNGAKRILVGAVGVTADLTAGAVGHHYGMKANAETLDVGADEGFTQYWAMGRISLGRHASLFNPDYLHALAKGGDLVIREEFFENIQQVACYLGRSLYMMNWGSVSDSIVPERETLAKAAYDPALQLFEDRNYAPSESMRTYENFIGSWIRIPAVRSRCFRSTLEPRGCDPRLKPQLPFATR